MFSSDSLEEIALMILITVPVVIIVIITTVILRLGSSTQSLGLEGPNMNIWIGLCREACLKPEALEK